MRNEKEEKNGDANSTSSTHVPQVSKQGNIRKTFKVSVFQCFPNASSFAPLRNICGRYKTCVLKAKNAFEIPGWNFWKAYFASWAQFSFFFSNVSSFTPALLVSLEDGMFDEASREWAESAAKDLEGHQEKT